MSVNPPPVPPVQPIPPVASVPSVPNGGYFQPAPGAPPVATSRTAWPQAPGAPSPTPAVGQGAPPRSTRLGVTALMLAIAAVAISVILSATTGFAAASGAMRDAIGLSPEGLENLSDDQLLALLSPVRGLVLWAEIGFWTGTVLGIWALVQGIVAIVTARGRGAAIAAVSIAAVAPIAWTIAVGTAVIVGIAAGAS